jgi:alcohol dehydrogenase class IV
MAEDARFADEENEAAEHEAATQAIALAGGNFEAAFTDPDDVAAQERMGTALRAALIKAIENWDAGR